MFCCNSRFKSAAAGTTKTNTNALKLCDDLLPNASERSNSADISGENTEAHVNTKLNVTDSKTAV